MCDNVTARRLQANIVCRVGRREAHPVWGRGERLRGGEGAFTRGGARRARVMQLPSAKVCEVARGWESCRQMVSDEHRPGELSSFTSA